MLFMPCSLDSRCCAIGSSLASTGDCRMFAKSEKATVFLVWKALLFFVHHRIYFTVANILQSPVC